MFQVRQVHLRPFAASALARFEDDLIIQVEQMYPEEVWQLTRDQLRVRIQACVERAGQYGVDRKEDVAEFVGLTFELGPDFERRPEYAQLARILNDSDLDGPAKMKRIMEILEDFEEIAAVD